MNLDGQSINVATALLESLNAVLAQRSQVYDQEGLDDEEGPSIDGQSVVEAQQTITGYLQQLQAEKQRLVVQTKNLVEKLERLGGAIPPVAQDPDGLTVTVHELHVRVKKRQSALTRAIGKEAVRFIGALSSQCVPNDLSDSDVGRYLRKVLECGYTVTLEPPHADQ